MSNKLRAIKPIPVVDAMLVSNVPETDYPEWSSTTAYALMDRVVRTTTHKVYESLIANPAVAVVTMTIAAPGVVTLADHGFAAGTAIKFSTTGALPTGLVVDTVYYVLTQAASTFNVAATVGGAAIATTGTQSGVHSVSGLLNYNKTPENDVTNWLEIGPTNRWKMFDKSNTTQTVRDGSIVVTLTTGKIVNSLALLNVVADTVRAQIIDPVDGTVYDKTFDMQAPQEESSWYSYFFGGIKRSNRVTLTDMPSYGSASVTITLTVAAGDAACGVLVLGTVRQIGAFGIEYGARVGVQDYSRKERDAFGNYNYVKRANSKKFTASMLVNNSDLDALNQFLSELDGPVVWVGSDTYESLIVYGFTKDYGTTITYAQYSQFTIDVEGLT